MSFLCELLLDVDDREELDIQNVENNDDSNIDDPIVNIDGILFVGYYETGSTSTGFCL